MSAKILMFGWEFPPHNSGGLGVACEGIVRALSKSGVRVVFVLPKRLSVDSAYARIIFADISEASLYAIQSSLTPYITHATYRRGARGHSIYAGNLMQEVFRYAARAREIVDRESFDVIYAHDWLSFPAAMEAKRRSGKPLIVHVHATEFDRCGGPHGINEEVYAIEKRGMEEADRVVAVSQLTKRIIVEKYHIDTNKVRVVYNGIDDETVPQPGYGRAQLSALKEAGYRIVLFLGRITLQKGPDYFLRAAQKVVTRDPKVAFIMSGSGDMERHMMELSANLGIAQNVFFSGFLRGAELHEAYRHADLFVMPSVSEPFGIAALEALKIGTPVLISKQSGVSEVVKHALKVDFWDVDELANKITSLLSYAPLHATLVENGMNEAKNLTWTAAAKNINDIVGELV